MSSIVALSPDYGVVHHHSMLGGVRLTNFSQFLEDLAGKLRQPNIPEGLPFLIWFDNAPCHNGGVVKCIEMGLQARKLSPYSPELNVVEFLFNAYKAALKAHLANAQVQQQPNESLYQARSRVLLAAAPQCIKAITAEGARNAYSHVKNVVIPKAIAMEDL